MSTAKVSIINEFSLHQSFKVKQPTRPFVERK